MIISPERLRLLRRSIAYAVVSVVVYLIALMFCFPYGRVKDAAIAIAAKQGYDLEIGSAGPSFPFGVLFEEVRVRSRTAPSPASAKPMQARFDSVRLALLPVVLSHGESFDVAAVGLGGQIALEGKMPKKGPFKIDLVVRDIAMPQVPGARELFNLPLAGTLGLTAHIESTTGKLADSHGEIEFKCVACSVGDGKTAAKLGNNPFLSAGLTLPKIRLGDLAGRIVIEKGVAKAQGIAIKSPDAEVTLDGDVTLRDPLPASTVNAYLRFKLGEPLLRAAPTLGSILQMAGAAGLRPDGFYGLRITGPLLSPMPVMSSTSPLPTTSPSPRPGGGHTSIAPAAAPSGMAAPRPPALVVPPPPPPMPVPAPQVPPAAPPPPPPPTPPQPPPEQPVAAVPARVGVPPPMEGMKGSFTRTLAGAAGATGGTGMTGSTGAAGQPGTGAAGGATVVAGDGNGPPPPPGPPPGAPPALPVEDAPTAGEEPQGIAPPPPPPPPPPPQ